MRRFDLTVVERREARWRGTRAEVITTGPRERGEIEMSQPSHSIFLRCEGVSSGYEWSDGSRRQLLPAIKPGSMRFIPAGSYGWCAMKMMRRTQFLVLTIDPGELSRLSQDDFKATQINFVARPALDDESVRRTLREIKREVDHPGVLDDLYRESLTALLLVQIVRTASNLAGGRGAVHGRGGLAGWRLRRALEALDADLENPPSLAALADHVGLSPSHVCHAFRQSMGVPPHQYVIQRRIARAKTLMADRQLSLTEIALRSGFNGSSQFSTIFRRAVGMAPSTYRQRL